ncbi:hypothetical protein KFK09_025697 [Dendrobium nobile]|uniref:Reverse transcriptase Ty1/copia-type domain-containing protein n=1 Tax=Dendrobium nobile TaxID=94219 RepID=A0A8T3A4I9_DENNO|nr:hypothetical protein KFK09_025697 [Dendrobium nobile]
MCFPCAKSSASTSSNTDNIPPLFLQAVSAQQQSQPPTSQHNTDSILAVSNPSHTTPILSQQQIAPDAGLPPPTVTNASTSVHPMTTRQRTSSLKPISRLNLLHNSSVSKTSADPSNFTEVNKHPEWRKAMASEFFALQQQGTWSLVPPPSNASVLGCRWTYRTKFHADGSVAHHKARLVGQGNHQEYGLDYTETFSPVAKLPTIRILLAVALHHEWPVQQLDVANAFLHGTLQETVYMTQPKGFADSTNPNYVCHLHKAIYGLKQAPRQWYNTLTSHLVSIGFHHSTSDPSLLTLRQDTSQVYLLVYVDDILITGDNSKLINKIINQLNQRFQMK